MNKSPFDCTLRELRVLLAVAEELHFGAAARRLGIAQPPLSQTVKRLEAKIGCPLFDRDTRRVELTEAGRILVAAASRALEDLGRAASDAYRVSCGEAGSLGVGFPTTVAVTILPRIVRKFRIGNPDIALKLVEIMSPEQIERIRAGSLDIGFVNEPISSGDLATMRVLVEPFVLVLAQNHPLARRPGPVSIAALSAEPFIAFPRQLGVSFHDRILAVCRLGGFAPRVVQETRTWSTLVGMVESGLGLSLVPASVSRLRIGRVVYRPIRPDVVRTTTAAMWRRDNRRPALDRFLSTVKRIAAADGNRREADPESPPRHRTSGDVEALTPPARELGRGDGADTTRSKAGREAGDVVRRLRVRRAAAAACRGS